MTLPFAAATTDNAPAGEQSEKECPTCVQTLPIKTDFGICRSRPDGRNLYCKSCIRTKVANSRKALQEYRQSRRMSNSAPRGARQPCLFRGTLNERVREAIRGGATTLKAIRTETKLTDADEIGDALADLLLWTREIRSELVNGERVYSIRDDGKLPIIETTQNNAQLTIARKSDVRSGFASIPELMPARITAGDAQRKVG